MFHGNEAGIVPRFPSNIRCDKFGHFQHGFFNIVSYYPNCLAISRFSDTPWDLEAKSWDREYIPQTVSLTVKPWELAGLVTPPLSYSGSLQRKFVWPNKMWRSGASNLEKNRWERRRRTRKEKMGITRPRPWRRGKKYQHYPQNFVLDTNLVIFPYKSYKSGRPMINEFGTAVAPKR